MIQKVHLDDPPALPDTFASSFRLEEFQDWIRITCWAEFGAPGNSRSELRKSCALIIPRSSVLELMQVLRDSVGPEPPAAYLRQ